MKKIDKESFVDVVLRTTLFLMGTLMCFALIAGALVVYRAAFPIELSVKYNYVCPNCGYVTSTEEVD